MFEAYTLLGAIAARTSSVKLGTLVTGVTYRNPAILAKIVTSLDVISKGRAFLGIGAAWFDFEHEGLGVDFPPVKERFERLEEALHICRAMFRGEQPTFDGKHYRVKDAINSPAPITPGGPPIMIGGQGEKKTLRLMAEHAEMANFTSGFDEIPHKLEVLAQHCAAVGRDMATINKTPLGSLILGQTMEEAEGKRSALLQERGLSPWDQLDEEIKAMIGARFVVGDADTAGEQLRGLLDLGLDGFTFNLPADGWEPDAVAFAGQVVTKAFG
jgi:F420-dependent oxidoreductase-like protein